jgi:glycosyltransferase involved in cell wall biosynthesis
MPTVSIGMPVYARPEFLKLAVESLLAQTFADFELILSDDASPDPAVRAACEAFAARDARVRYIRQEKNLGVFANFVYVFEHSTAPLFHLASEDDLWEPAFLGQAVGALDADKSKALWFCHLDAINRSGQIYFTPPPFSRFQSRGHKRRELVQFLFEPEILGKSNLFHAVFRREAVADSIPLLQRIERVWGMDNVFVYGCLCRHDCVIDASVLFHKRADTDKSQRSGRWPRLGVYPAKRAWEYLSAYRLAAAGTPYATMTGLLLPLRFALDQIYKIGAAGPALAEGAGRMLARHQIR